MYENKSNLYIMIMITTLRLSLKAVMENVESVMDEKCLQISVKQGLIRLSCMYIV